MTNIFKAARSLRGYTQEYMAKSIGISTRTYGRKESNPENFTVGEIEKLANVLNLEKEIFFKNEFALKGN